LPQLSSDLQSANASTTATGSGSAANVNRQALLIQLQQNIGYASSNLSNIGNFLNLVA